MYGLCDGNNFFVSCERVFNSSLDGKPVIVLSNNDGCAIARSEEAKALGIKMGANYFEVEDIIRRNNVQVFSTNFVLYADMSMRMKGLLSRFTPKLEDYSIDEAFLDFSGVDLSTLNEYGLDVVRTVTQGTGVPVSLGIAPTKTLAKLANRFAKKYPGYQNVCVIDTDEKRIKALRLTDVSDIWGIGRRSSQKLKDRGVNTAYDFTQLSRSWVRKHMTVIGERTWCELLGEPCIEVEAIAPDKQSIMVSRSFGKMLDDLEVIKEAAASYTSMAAAKLRKQRGCAKSILVFLETNPFRDDLPQYRNHVIVNMPVATNSTMEIIKYMSEGLYKIFRTGFNYKKVGVMLLDIISEGAVQGYLWDNVDRAKHKRLMEIIDSTNNRYGTNSLKLAVLGDGEQWKIKQRRLSPCYTTRIKDFPKVK